MAAPFCPLAHRADWHTVAGQANPLGGCRRCWCNQSAVLVSHGHFFFFACCFHSILLSIFHCFSKNSCFLIPQIFLCCLIFSWFFSVTPVSSLIPCLWILLMQSTFISFHATFIHKKKCKTSILRYRLFFLTEPLIKPSRRSLSGCHMVEFSPHMGPGAFQAMICSSLFLRLFDMLSKSTMLQQRRVFVQITLHSKDPYGL